MLKYLENNYVLSFLVSILVVVFVYFDRKKTNKEKLHLASYGKLFASVFVLVLLALFYKTKDYSLPYNLKGQCVKAPWSGGGPTQVVGPTQSFGGPTQSFSNPTTSFSGPNPVGSGLVIKELNLNEVNINDPQF